MEAIERPLIYCVWLAEAIGHAAGVYVTLKHAIGGAEEVYRLASYPEELKLPAAVVRRLCDKSLDSARRTVDFCVTHGITILSPETKGYPSLLRELDDMPAILYLRGRVPDFEKVPATAVVGTRKMSEYGMERAYALGFGLGRGGSLVVSGMAAGGDALALCGALDAGGTPIAVLGCGVDVVYPPKNRYLYEEIVARGAVISEYAPGTEVTAANFPVRNRIISGISRITVVTEADRHSGALITARHAERQGRLVCAVPNAVGAAGAEGTNDLIREGADVVLEAEDVLKNYLFLYPECIRLPKGEIPAGTARLSAEAHRVDLGRTLASPPEAKTPAAHKPAFEANTAPVRHHDADREARLEHELTLVDARTASLYRALPNEPFTPDDVTDDNYNIGDVLCALTVLECHALVRALPGGKYEKTN